MQLRDAIALIGKAPLDNTKPETWADLGCGSGLFTRALATLLHPDSTIYAIDKTPQTLPKPIQFRQGDFEKDPLPPVDGILMANALHYVKDKAKLIAKLNAPRYILVEYDTRQANPWVPYPIGKDILEALFKDVIWLGDRPSAFGRARMYAAMVGNP
jgi:SAM-dependent methyltransferase